MDIREIYERGELEAWFDSLSPEVLERAEFIPYRLYAAVRKNRKGARIRNCKV